jgi:hypothetical protein
VKNVSIQVTGAEQFSSSLSAGAFSGDEARLHYVPGVSSGMLVFSATALDGAGTVIARGATSDVTLLTGQAVSAFILLQSSNGSTDGGGDAPIDARDAPGADRTDAADAATDDGGGDVRPPGKKGEPCSAAAACDSALFCADGVCCDTRCDTACNACNLTGREGTCSPVAAGAAPATGHPACAADDPSTCQKDGVCDGAGACHLYAVGTVCRASKCDMTTDAFTPDFKCDGRGVCQSNIAIACAPFKCKDTSVCYATCSDGTQCAAGKSCVGGSCGLKPRGATCVQGAECADGNCADGVCCDRPCQAGCEACNLPSKTGTCTPVPAGQDPKGICPAGMAENAVCSPGGCDGTGGASCRKADITAECRLGSCVAGIAVNPATCQSNGSCPIISQTPCGLYTCGAMACNTTCADDTQCVMGYYCASNKSCLAKKTPGTGCAATNECQAGLTCLDGVCCMTPSCGSCRNCGSTGTCNITVASADDTTGTTCSGTKSCNSAGSCVLVNGQSCGVGGSGTACVSGNCVDGVCCSVASCGACRNCGTTGACSVTVTNADDTSNLSCANDSSCDAMGSCKPRWSLVGKVATVEQPYPGYSAGAGNYIYFANPNNSGGGAQYFKSFNVATSAFADENKTNNPLCACGYGGTLVGQPLDGRIYYAANTAASYIAGAATWTNFSGTYPSRGEAATAVLGKRIYYAGGRGALASVQAYDTTAGAWITTGIVDAPMGFDSACAGAAGGVVYVFGGRARLSMLAYTESTNKWSAVTATPPANCNAVNLPTWRGKLAMADGSGLEVFNPSTQLWDAPVPLPSLAGAYSWSAVVTGTGTDLYVLSWTGGSTYIYKWVFN